MKKSVKKVKMSIVALVTALLIPSSALASPWTYVGEETLPRNGYESDVYPSKGNNYRICRDDFTGPDKVKVELWEYDPLDPNDYVGTRYIEKGECGYFWNIDPHVDGGDEAEFFAKSRTDSSFHLMFWD